MSLMSLEGEDVGDETAVTVHVLLQAAKPAAEVISSRL